MKAVPGLAVVSSTGVGHVATPPDLLAESPVAVVSAKSADPRQALVERLASSTTFEKAHRLREFFLHVCRCAIENRPGEASEQQIGIRVFGRTPGYNANGDNIVRSQARLLRLKLEHHFANEGKDEPLIVSIPKGQYLPVFESRPQNLSDFHLETPTFVAPARPLIGRRNSVWLYVFALTVVVVGATIWLRSTWLKSHPSPAVVLSSSRKGTPAPAGSPGQTAAPQVPALTLSGEVRIAAGLTDGAFVDAWGHRWESDRYYKGGASRPGPKDLSPSAPDPGLVRTMRESTAPEADPQSQQAFTYDIPVPPGVYELRLYFADPIRRSAGLDSRQDGENLRHFGINLNGRSLLSDFDAIADGGFASVNVRAFKDVVPADDGMVHLEFVPGTHGSFVNALELTPGTPGKLVPIRLSVRASGFTDAQGTRWSGDNFFVNGRTGASASPEAGAEFPALYSDERYGNFSYAIPAPPGSYTVRLHFAETFFNPSASALLCHGTGCRVFNVTCNGVVLLRDFDILQTAGGAFRPVVRAFHGLHPNGQGKLLLSFSPSVNYAEVRAIEVLDEAK